MRTIELERDDALIAFLRKASPNATPERAALEAIVLELYRRRIVSSGKAAESRGVKRVDFIVCSGEFGIPFFDMSREEWEREMQAVEDMLRSRSSSTRTS